MGRHYKENKVKERVRAIETICENIELLKLNHVREECESDLFKTEIFEAILSI